MAQGESDSHRSLLAHFDGQLPFRLGHFAPKLLQVSLQRLIVRIFSQGQREPAICRGKIMRRTQPRRVKCAHLTHGRRIRLIGCRFQQSHAAFTILRHPAPVNIFLRLCHMIDGLRRRNCRVRLSRLLNRGVGFRIGRRGNCRCRRVSSSPRRQWWRSRSRRCRSRIRRGIHRTIARGSRRR